MRHVCGFALLFLVASRIVLAQDSRADLFGGYSYLNVDTNGLTSRQNANGWEASISGNFNRWFAAEADVSGYYRTLFGVNVSDYSYLAGPRVNFKPLFIHILVGGDHLRGSALGASASQDSLAGAFGGGLQWKVSRQFSFRMSADYALTRHNILGGPSVTQNNVRASVGIVYSFGATKRVSAEPREAGAPVVSAGTKVPALGMSVIPGPNGVEIVDALSGGIAAVAGLHPGDVINAVDGRPVKTPVELTNALSGMSPGTKVRLGYMIRGQWQSETTVILGNP